MPERQTTTRLAIGKDMSVFFKAEPSTDTARVFISVVGDEEAALKNLRWLRSKATEIRQEIGRRIVLKFLPKFEYRIDESTAHSVRMLQLLDEIAPASEAGEKPKAE